ncbi:glutathione S-transferase [Pseudomonas sp. WN033]|nr:glutathione S-transferase [Pseudomonas sp. WN033]
MPLTLYGAILSPFVRKVRIVLAEHSIAHEHVPVPPFQQPDWYRDISPLGRIPAIRDGELNLADSAVIAQYLEDTYGQTSLYGNDPQQAAQVRWLEKYADYELAPWATFAVFRNRIVKPVVGQHCDETQVREALDERLPPLFDYLEGLLNGRRYFVGERLTLADIAVTCQLINLAHAGELIDELRWPNLSSLLSQVSARSTVSALLPAEHQLVGKMKEKASGSLTQPQ